MAADTAAAPAPAAFRGSGPFLAKAPSFWLPMRHFVASAVAFWVFAAALFWGRERFLGFDFDARWVLGLTHTLTLGWLAMTIFGALCQLTPVLWETSLSSERLAAAAWWLFAAGSAAFVGTIWAGGERYWLPASAVVAAVVLYLTVFAKTMRSAARLDRTGVHLINAFAYLAALVTLGLLLAIDRQRGMIFRHPEGALVTHIHFAVVGWLSLTIIGVSYRLVSMFALAQVESKALGRFTLVAANVGLILMAVDSLWLGRRWTELWAGLLVSAYVAYAAHMRRLFSARLKRIDPSLAFTLAALVGGFFWCLIGCGLASGVLEDCTENRLAYVSCALLGWATPFTLGQIHKIVPFLVWLHVYSPRDWKPPVRVPKIEDLTSERLAWLELATLVPAVALLVGGFWTRRQAPLNLGAALLLACATLYATNLGETLIHVFRRDPRWTPIAPPSSTP